MPFWQRLVITIVAMLIAGFVAGLIWRIIFDAAMPSYLAGMIGGLTAIPIWEWVKKIKISNE
jgi:ABC-type sugar transport system permease subunit